MQHRVIDICCDENGQTLSDTFHRPIKSILTECIEQKNANSFESKFTKFICITMGGIITTFAAKRQNNTASLCGLLILATSKSTRLCILNARVLSKPIS